MDIHVFTVFRKNSLTLIFRKIANTNKTKQKKKQNKNNPCDTKNQSLNFSYSTKLWNQKKMNVSTHKNPRWRSV